LSVDVRSLYEEKTHSGYYSTVRSEVASLFDAPAGLVADIGCGAGATLCFLSEVGLARKTIGVDISSEMLMLAKSSGVDRVIHADIEREDLLIEQESVDIFLCLDVLEHLADPWAVLRKLRMYLKPGGTIIASIPNVQNLKVILPLIFLGNWQYRESGILDKTHLRFFTKRTAIDLFADSGFQFRLCEPIYEPNLILRIANIVSLCVFRRFFVSRFLLKASKASDE
jgi:2-polyprenyl-3-methyl-5-hydroxy-6-metoxy-1,4-benzoquinol methylase